MFIPLDYQLDSLKALHLLYYAFPPPVRVTFYGFNNKSQIDSEIYSKMHSFYTDSLDDTSIARFYKVRDLPFYFITGGDSGKQQSSDEFGSVFNQPELTGVVPSITGLEFINEEYIVFSSSGVVRLFTISNIEISNINESMPLRLYKLTLKLSRYKDTTELEDRTDVTYQYVYETNKIYQESVAQYIYQTLFPTLHIHVSKLDKFPVKKYVDDFLSKFYFEYKLIYNILLSKYNYVYPRFFKQNYNTEPYTYFFDNPDGVAELPDVNDIEPYRIMIKDFNQEQYNNHPYLFDNLVTDIENESVTIQQYIQDSNPEIDFIMAIYMLTKTIDRII